MLLNTAILFFLLGKFGGPAISAGLKKRKETIAGDIQRAAQMKAEAEEQLGEYEAKLAAMESEMTRIKKELSEQAQSERERLLADSKDRAEAIAAEARQMVEQQLSSAKQQAIEAAVHRAVQNARAELEKSLNGGQQQALAQDIFSSLDAHFARNEVQS